MVSRRLNVTDGPCCYTRSNLDTSIRSLAMENFRAFHKNAQASMAIANASIEANTQSFSQNSAASRATPSADTQIGMQHFAPRAGTELVASSKVEMPPMANHSVPPTTQELPAAPYFFRELKNGTVVSIGEPLSVAVKIQKHGRKHERKPERKHQYKAATASSTDLPSRHNTGKDSSVAEESGRKQGQGGTPSAGHGRRTAKAIYEAMKIEAVLDSTAPSEDSESPDQHK